MLALATLIAGCSSGKPETPLTWRAAYQPFSNDSPLRIPLPDEAPAHRDSKRMIDDLVQICGPDPDGPCKYPRLAGAPEADRFFSRFGTPVYLARETDRRRTVACTRFACGVAGITGEDTRALYNVPMPTGARPDPSDDGHLVVYDLVKASAWEFFRASYSVEKDEWEAEGGIRWDLTGQGVDALRQPGTAVGGGTPMFGTIVTPDEVREAIRNGTGVVPHVLSGGYDSPRKDCFISPLVKTSDADDGRRWAIPEGAILRLDPTLDLTALELEPAAQLIARTLQVYGMVIRDDTGAFTIDVENTSVEDAAEPGRSGTWKRLGITNESLRAVRSEMFDVVAWDAADAHGANCP
ncbi:MAG: hypothetical protein ACRDKS_04750 [Actinomycetota bacterium]